MFFSQDLLTGVDSPTQQRPIVLWLCFKITRRHLWVCSAVSLLWFWRRGSGRDAWTSVQEDSVRTGLSFILLFLFFQVLKAIGLQRTGKQDEAFSLAQEVSVLEPTDDNSLQALTILFREMHRREYTRGGGVRLQGHQHLRHFSCHPQRSWWRSCTRPR